jgi:putative addiction module component (TIGR02574 family)
MSLSIDDIKKLPDQEKLRIIDELLVSIDDSVINEYLTETEEDNILRERLEEYQSGKMQFDSWENVQERLREKARLRQKKDNNDIHD